MGDGGSEVRLRELITEIRDNSNPHIDGDVLSCAVELIYRIGLRKNEITSLTVSQVSIADSLITPANSQGKASKKSIPLSNSEKEILQRHLDYLNSHVKYSISPGSALFPGYEGSNGLKQLTRHFKSLPVYYENIHKLGIKAAYEKFSSEGMSKEDAVKKTSEKFRLTDRHTWDVLRGSIQPAGRRKKSRRKDEYYLLEMSERPGMSLDSSESGAMNVRSYPESKNQMSLGEMIKLFDAEDVKPKRKAMETDEDSLLEDYFFSGKD